MLTERKRGRARERHLLGWGQRRDGNHPGGGSLTGGTVWMVAYL